MSELFEPDQIAREMDENIDIFTCSVDLEIHIAIIFNSLPTELQSDFFSLHSLGNENIISTVRLLEKVIFIQKLQLKYVTNTRVPKKKRQEQIALNAPIYARITASSENAEKLIFDLISSFDLYVSKILEFKTQLRIVCLAKKMDPAENTIIMDSIKSIEEILPRLSVKINGILSLTITTKISSMLNLFNSPDNNTEEIAKKNAEELKKLILEAIQSLWNIMKEENKIELERIKERVVSVTQNMDWCSGILNDHGGYKADEMQKALALSHLLKKYKKRREDIVLVENEIAKLK